MIKSGVSEPFEVDDRTVRTAFGGVVEDHIENHPDTRPVQCFDQVAKFLAPRNPARGGAVAGMDGKETVRTVTPVILQPQSGHAVQHILFVEGHDRHQLHIRHTQRFEVGDLLNQTGESARMGNSR